MKKTIVFLIIVALIGGATFLQVEENRFQDISQERDLWSKDYYVEPEVELEYKDGKSLVYLGIHLGHTVINGTSCFGSCHGVTEGGHPQMRFPGGGGLKRTLEKRHNELFSIVPGVTWTDDMPIDDSPGWLDTHKDPCILWDCHEPRRDGMSINEEQAFRGIDGHDLEGIENKAKRDPFSQYWAKEAFGDSEINMDRVFCALAAAMQNMNSSQSNVSKGQTENIAGQYLFENSCYNCHENADSIRAMISPDPNQPKLTKPPHLANFFQSPTDYRSQRKVDLGMTDFQRFNRIVKEHMDADMVDLGRWDRYRIYKFMKEDHCDNDLDRYNEDWLNLSGEYKRFSY